MSRFHGGSHGGFHGGYGGGYHNYHNRGFYPGYGGVGLATGLLAGAAIATAANPYGYGGYYGPAPYNAPYQSTVIYEPTPPIIVPVSNASEVAALAAANPNLSVSYIPAQNYSPRGLQVPNYIGPQVLPQNYVAVSPTYTSSPVIRY